MRKGNGGRIGPQNIPTVTVASGMFSMDEQQQSLGARSWPGQPSATVPNSPGFSNFASFTGYISGTVLTVSAITSGTIAAGQFITGAGISQYTRITSQTSGTTGGVGVYVVNTSQTAGSSGSQIAISSNLSLPTNTSISIPYSLNYDGGSPITSVTALAYSGSTLVGSASGSSSPLTISGLTAGTIYSVALYATNSVGNSSQSIGPYFQTPGPPAAPTIGTATLSGSSGAFVAFTPPSNNGGSVITSYTVVSNPGGLTATGASSPIFISGLNYSTSYTFTVYATNALGNGSSSSASNSITTGSGPVSLTSDVLVVAGGGGAAWLHSGGGGGGGMRYFTGLSLQDSTTYNIVVGAGGASASAAGVNASPGTLSYFNNSTYQSAGGGYAGGYGNNGGNGGAGGGSGSYYSPYTGGSGNTPSTSPSQGANGGGNSTSTAVAGPGGGGGGASGTNGANAPTSTAGAAGGAGGNGTAVTITGTSTYFAGGGAGNSYNNAGYGSGGLGGGGNGGNDTGDASNVCTYSQSGSVITVTYALHGLTVGTRIGFLGSTGTTPPACQQYVVQTVPNSSTFTLTAYNSATSSGNGYWSISKPGQNGTANTGGGGGNGGGGYKNDMWKVSGNGGSGVVIVRIQAVAVATTGSPVITQDGAYYVYQFNNNGSITF
jgi:hypothetical protein